MTLSRVKLGRTVTFIKYLTGVVSLIFQAKTLFLSKIMFPEVSFAESCRAGGK